MSKSLLQMVNELFSRVAALEAQLKERAKEPEVTITPLGNDMLQRLQKLASEQPQPTRQMCPKCGEKPNYFFHVKNCTGQKKNKNDADDQRRDSSKA